MAAQKETDSQELTDKQKRFCEEYVNSHNATLAIISSGICSPEKPKGFYVYFLVNSVTNHIFYVGKGKGRRSKSHLLNFLRGKESNPAKEIAIQNTIEMGGHVLDFIFADNLRESDAFRTERKLIGIFPELTNLSNGVFHQSEITILRARKSLAKMISEEEMLKIPINPELGQIDRTEMYYKIKTEIQKIADGILPLREIIVTHIANQPSKVEYIHY